MSSLGADGGVWRLLFPILILGGVDLLLQMRLFPNCQIREGAGRLGELPFISLLPSGCLLEQEAVTSLTWITLYKKSIWCYFLLENKYFT